MSARVLDLFSAAAGGWTLGMHRAGFTTMAACEAIDWRRALYSENNPGVPVYDDVKTLTADRLVRDGHGLPDIVVGSPPCQDISSANTKGKGVEGERSGLFFEAIRIIGECRPRWFALENSSNLRTRGADAVLAALEAIGYTCWTFVVRAGDIGANHERPRAWIIGCDLGQVPHANSQGEFPSPLNEQMGKLRSVADSLGDTAEDGRGSWLPRRCVGAAARPEQSSRRDDANPTEKRSERIAWGDEQRQGEVAERADLSSRPEMGLCAGNRVDITSWGSDWSLNDLANRVLLDDGLSAWLAGARIAVGGPKGTSAASLVVEAFGDAVVPQIPEAIGRAILRTERALAQDYGRVAA